MNKKYLIIGIIVLAAFFFLYKKKNESASALEMDVQTAASQKAAQTLSNATATDVVKASATESQKAETSEIEARLRSEYRSLAGKEAPSDRTILQLQDDISQLKLMNEALLRYTALTGDNDYSDNNFNSKMDVENAIVAHNDAIAKKKAENEEKRKKWNAKKTSIQTVKNNFNASFQDDGTALKKKNWSDTAYYGVTGLDAPGLVYLAYLIQTQGMQSDGKKYNDPIAVLSTPRSTSDKRKGRSNDMKKKFQDAAKYTISNLDEFGILNA